MSEYVACSVIEFGDGGEPSVMLLQRGTREECETVATLLAAVTREECETVATLLAAVSYSGERRPITGSYLVVAPAEHYEEAPA